MNDAAEELDLRVWLSAPTGTGGFLGIADAVIDEIGRRSKRRRAGVVERVDSDAEHCSPKS